MRGVIRQVFTDHLPAVLAERELGEREWRGAWCVSTCRTAEQGTHVSVCGCGHSEGEAFNSCRHRGCPQCGGPATRRWVEARAAQVLGCAHVHTIWTVPDVFGALWAFNRTVFTNLMFRACWETVRTLLTRMIERRNQVREGDVVYGYVNENVNEGDSGQPEGSGDSQ